MATLLRKEYVCIWFISRCCILDLTLRTAVADYSRLAPAFHFGAGLFSGLSSAILLQPADLLKTRLQQQRASVPVGHRGGGGAAAKSLSATATLTTTIRDILASPTPIRKLWRGTVPSALRTGFGSALYFTSLNALRSEVAKHNQQASFVIGTITDDHGKAVQPRSTSALPQVSNTANLVTGSLARVFAGFVMMPVTVLKVRYESSFYNYTTLWTATREIIRTEGIRSMFAGFGATAIRDAPYAGLYVVFYEQLKTSFVADGFRSKLGNEEDSNVNGRNATVNFISAAVASTLATTVTNPFDVIKTRVQLMPATYRNMIHAMKLIIIEKKDGGVRCLFDGVGLRMARKAVSSALAWSVYEELVLRAQREWTRNWEGDGV